MNTNIKVGQIHETLMGMDVMITALDWNERYPIKAKIVLTGVELEYNEKGKIYSGARSGYDLKLN